MMPKFDVYLTREIIENCVMQVEAESKEDAEGFCLQYAQANEVPWEEFHTPREYGCKAVEVKEPPNEPVPAVQSVALEPPDLEQCQAAIRNGANAFTVGGTSAYIRCTNKPVVVVTQNKPGDDGLCGSMAICDRCYAAMIAQEGDDFATATYIEKQSGPSDEEIEASVQVNMAELSQYNHVFNQIMQINQEVELDCDPKFFGVVKFNRAAQDISDIATRFSACKQGCSHCCHMATSLTETEAEYIGAMIKVKPRKLPSRDLTEHTRAEFVAQYHGVGCPFLVEGQCAIYKYRPFACKTYFNLSDYPEICDLVNHPGHYIPALNVNELTVAYVMLIEDFDRIGDIREFFPDGLNT